MGIDLSMVTEESPLLGHDDSDYREFITPGNERGDKEGQEDIDSRYKGPRGH